MTTLGYVIKLVLAIVLGGIIGFERENQHKDAGLRTCILVTMSATMVMMFSEILSLSGTMDVVRAPSYMLTSIGFLGAGIIMARGNKIEGITTAALMLVLVPMGVLIGIGEYILATICALLIFFVLKLKHLELHFKLKFKKKRTIKSPAKRGKISHQTARKAVKRIMSKKGK